MKYVFAHPKPGKHQVRAFKKLWRNQGGANSMPMRSGKTRVAVEFVSALFKFRQAQPLRVLVICPYQQGSIPRVWQREVKKWSTVPYWLHVGPPKRRRIPVYGKGVTWYVIWYQRVYDREYSGKGRQWYPVDAEWMEKYKPHVVILDESHRVGDPTTVESRKIYKLIKHLRDKGEKPVVVIQTGTMLHRTVFMAFGQYKILDDSIFGTNWTAFKKTYGVFGGYASRVLLKYVNKAQFRKKIEPVTFNMIHVPPRPEIHQTLTFQLKESRPYYAEMASESMIEGVVEAPLVITRIRKLAQLASGYVRDEDKVIHRFGREMRNTLQGHLEESLAGGVEKVVIGCNEYPQLRDVAEAAKGAGYKILTFHGGVKRGEEKIERFQSLQGPIAFCCISSSAREGIDLSAADTMIFYDVPDSLVIYDQFKSRIRKYKDQRALTYYYIIPEGTAIAVKYLALQQKLEVVRLIMHHPEILHYKEEG